MSEEHRTAIAIAFEAARNREKDKEKSEAISRVNKNSRTAEDEETYQQTKWKDQTALNSAKRKNKRRSRKKLNDLGMGSHRTGSVRDERKISVTDNIDWGTSKLKTVYKSGKQLIGYRDVSFLRREDDVEWITLSEIDYSTQLLIGLPKKDRPRRVVKSGNKVFLDPDVFVDLVEKQERQNDVKLVLSFDRGSATKRTGNLNMIVANPKNPDHDYGDTRGMDKDNEWTRRVRRDGTTGKKGV